MGAAAYHVSVDAQRVKMVVNAHLIKSVMTRTAIATADHHVNLVVDQTWV